VGSGEIHWIYLVPLPIFVAMSFWGAYLKSFDDVKLSYLRISSAGLPLLLLYSGWLSFYFEIVTMRNPYPVPTGIVLMILGIAGLIYSCRAGRKKLEADLHHNAKPTFNPHD